MERVAARIATGAADATPFKFIPLKTNKKQTNLLANSNYLEWCMPSGPIEINSGKIYDELTATSSRINAQRGAKRIGTRAQNEHN